MAFKKGQSGNPAGKKKGVVNKNTLMADALDNYHKRHGNDIRQQIVDRILEDAAAGDSNASKMVIERLIPTMKPVMLPVNLDSIPRMPKSPVDKANKLLSMILNGNLTIDQGVALIAALNNITNLTEIQELNELAESAEQLVKEKSNETHRIKK